MSIYKKLNAARAAFHGKQLKKSGRNNFAGYDYFELGDFLIPAMQVLADQGLCAVVSFSKEVATMQIVDIEQPEQQITITSPMGSAALKGCHEVQNIGAVETYQRRYLWVAAMEIVEHDALDATTGKDRPAPKVKPVPEPEVPPEQMEYLRELAMELIGSVKAGKPREAYEKTERENLDNEQKTALWGMLDSTTRSAIKTAKVTPL